jgi:hypothetical protein
MARDLRFFFLSFHPFNERHVATTIRWPNARLAFSRAEASTASEGAAMRPTRGRLQRRARRELNHISPAKTTPLHSLLTGRGCFRHWRVGENAESRTVSGRSVTTVATSRSHWRTGIAPDYAFPRAMAWASVCAPSPLTQTDPLRRPRRARRAYARRGGLG